MAGMDKEALAGQERFWLGYIHRHQGSGLSMAAHARSQGLVANTFYGWHSRLKKRQVIGAGPAAVLFHRVDIKPDDSNHVSDAVSLLFRLPNGIDCKLSAVIP